MLSEYVNILHLEKHLMLLIAMGTYPLRAQLIQEQTRQQTCLFKYNLKK